jgi:hypothetical protein
MKYPPRNPTLLLCILFFQHSVLAQDKLPIKFGKLDIRDFDVKSISIDSDINAAVVADFGRSKFIANTHQVSFSLIFNRRIKRLNDIDIIKN